MTYLGPINETSAQSNVLKANLTCGVRLGTTAALPILNQWGTNGTKVGSLPSYCECDPSGGPGLGWGPYCDVFDLLLTLVMFNDDDLLDNLGSILAVQSADLKRDNYIALDSYNASYANAAMSYENSNPLLSQPQWLEDAFKFCRSPHTGKSCTLLTFNVFDNYTTSVSPYSFQLSRGSCFNSISLSDEGWENLASTHPAQLSQEYYKCTQGVYSSMFNAVGIASGNVATVIPIVVVMILPMFYFFLRVIGQVPPKVEYTKDELQDSLDVLALHLLRMRDRKTRGLKLNGMLFHLTKELVEASKVEGGYPDSDDSEEDDDDDDDGVDSAGIRLVGRNSAYGQLCRLDKSGNVIPRESGISLVRLEGEDHQPDNQAVGSNGDVEQGIELRPTGAAAGREGARLTDHRVTSNRASFVPTKRYLVGGRKMRGAVFTK
jgi:hypothetical protein